MTGPPGVGKTMLARRMVSILPPLDRRGVLACVPRLQHGRPVASDPVRFGLRPFRAPHHSATRAGLLGGAGAYRAKCRWPTTACCSSTSSMSFPGLLESLRQPLEDGGVVLARLPRPCVFPPA